MGTSSARSIPLGALSSRAESAGEDNLELIRSAIASLTSSPPGKTVVLGVDDVALPMICRHSLCTRSFSAALPRSCSPSARVNRFLPGYGSYGMAGILTASTCSRCPKQKQPRSSRRRWAARWIHKPLSDCDVDPRQCFVSAKHRRAGGCRQRLAMQDDYWRWLGDPVLPPSLIELVEGRIGGLPSSVSDVIDALAVGEPIELGSLTRITDPAAVEQADIRGLIALDQVGDRVEARLAHPLYGEVRRNRAAATRLRRLRGLVAAELAASDDRDDMQVVVRRATLSLDSDLEPDPDLLVRAASGAVWLWEFPLADRFTAAAIHAGGGADRNSFAPTPCRVQDVAWKPMMCSPASRQTSWPTPCTGEWPSCGPQISCSFWLIRSGQRSSSTMIPRRRSTGSQLYRRFLTVYWAAMGRPQAAIESSDKFTWQELPDLVAQRVTAWALALAFGEAGRAGEAAAAAKAGYPIPIRSFVIITDAHLGALLLAGHIADAAAPAETIRQRQSGFRVQSFQVASLPVGRAAL